MNKKSGHWTNTGMAKFINDNLYNYKSDDEKSMNPFRWYRLQNGDDVSKYRETINGFPCRLILINDGSTPLNEGQNEPTPGNTKDMGIFNFNHDKDATKTLGFDSDIFPSCASYEVTANSDTSAGAFMSFKHRYSLNGTSSNLTGQYSATRNLRISDFTPLPWTIKSPNRTIVVMRVNNDTTSAIRVGKGETVTITEFPWGTDKEVAFRIGDVGSELLTFELNGCIYTLDRFDDGENVIALTNQSEELAYLKESFELRHPDADDVAEDWGFMGVEEKVLKIDEYLYYGSIKTSNMEASYFNSDSITIIFDNNASFSFVPTGTNVSPQYGVRSGTTISLEGVDRFNLAAKDWTYVDINGNRYYKGITRDEGVHTRDENPYESTIFNTSYGLKALIDWVDNCTDEEFVRDFEEHFHKDYTLRYYCLVLLCGMVDNMGKNMMLDTADNKIFFPRFYDIDTCCSYDNSGQLKFDVDIEMEQGYWNTSSSRLWTRIRDLMHDDIVATYNDMRQNGVSYENMMHYIYDEQIAKIPQTYYNKDYDIKYAPFADSYIGMAHGDTYEHVKRWLKQRFTFVDTLFDYAPSYNNDVLTIRVNTTEEITLHLETYTPVYQHLSWYNGQMDKKKIDGKTSITFSGKVQAATDQEVLIYGGSNIKKITGIQSGNPNRLILGSATKLTELDASNCPLLSEINMNKANLSPHEYLNKVNLSNCPLLEGNLRLNNSPLIQELDIRGTNITGMNLSSSIRNLQVLRLPNTMTELTLNDAGMLHTLEFDEGIALQSISMTNCNNLTNVVNFDLLQTPSITLDNSYNNVSELYFRDTTNLTVRNMKSLERIIFTPNAEYETFELINVANAPDYKVTTFNCPKLSTFMTTAPYRESYNDCGTIQETRYVKDYNNLVDILIDKTPLNAIVNENTGEVTSTQSGIHYTSQDYIEVMGDTEYTINLTNGTSTILNLAFYNNSLEYITGVNQNSSWSSYTFTTPSNCCYIRYHIHCDSTQFQTSELLSPSIIEEIVYKKDYGDIQPNTTFTANSIDISNTQFTDVKLLCTTDTNTLKLPTTVKNFYCDSSFDLDTNFLEDGEYDVIHGELVEQYTTDYKGEVNIFESIEINIVDNGELGAFDGATLEEITSDTVYRTDFIRVIPGTVVKFITINNQGTVRFQAIAYDENKENPIRIFFINGYAYTYDYTVPSTVHYVRYATANTTSYISAPIIRTPNLIPSSADGSLIFSMYAPSNTVAPVSGTWDLKGLEFNNFHTFGMNNDVMPSEDSYVKVYNGKNLKIFQGSALRNNPSGSVYIDKNQEYRRVLSPIYLPKGSHTYAYSNGNNSTIYYVTELNGSKTQSLEYGHINITSEEGGYAHLTYITNDPNYPKPMEWIKIDDVYYMLKNVELITFDDTSNGFEYSVYDYIDGEVDSRETSMMLMDIKSLTMPARYDDYNITIKNANISPKTHNTMLYPLLVNEDNPIEGKLDYTNYVGNNLSWSFAYVNMNKVNIVQPKDELLNTYEYRYNAFYETEYEFDDPNEVLRYITSSSNLLPTFNEGFTYTYDKLDNNDGTYIYRIYANDPTLLTSFELEKVPYLRITNAENLLSPIDLTKYETVSISESYYDITELYFREATNLTLTNMPYLERVIYLPNDEYEVFEIINVVNSKDYIITTSECPRLTTFMTTASHRESYNNEDAIAEVITEFTNTDNELFTNEYVFSKTYWEEDGTEIQGSVNLLHYEIPSIEDSVKAIHMVQGLDSTNRVTFFNDDKFISCEVITTACELDFKLHRDCNRIVFICEREGIVSSVVESILTTTLVKEYGSVEPNIIFNANTLDISNTQFTDVKLLCTTDLNVLKLPTTVKNFYCDSSFDLDTDYLTDGEYDIVHGEFVEPYTTDYEGEIKVDKGVNILNIVENGSLGAINTTTGVFESSTLFYSTDYINVEANSFICFEVPTNRGATYHGVVAYDVNKTYISGIYKGGGSDSVVEKQTLVLPDGTVYIRAYSNNDTAYIEYNAMSTPNLIPSSSDGSLIFSMYAPSKAPAPASNTWDLYGLEFDNFHTFGMNNDVKGEYTYERYVLDSSKLYKIHNDSGDNAIWWYDGWLGEMESNNSVRLLPLKISDKNLNVSISGNKGSKANLNLMVKNSSGSVNQTESSTYPVTRNNAIEILIAYFGDTSNLEYIDIDLSDGRKYRIYVKEITNIYSTNATLTEEEKTDIINNYTFNIDSVVDMSRSRNIVSLTMPSRYNNYNVTIKNANILPKTYNTMLYPLLVNEDNPIEGKLDYTDYNGEYLSWSFAYTNTNKVNIIQPKDELLNSYEYRYNAFYRTEYEFNNPNEVMEYTTTSSNLLPIFNEGFTYAYDKIDNDDGTYTYKIYANDISLLTSFELEKVPYLRIVNAENLVSPIDLTKYEVVEIDNSYSNITELYFRDSTNLTLNNMSNLERVIFTPNNEYETFDLINVANAPDYKVTTFNCPKLSTFMTTAPYRESYNNCGVKDKEVVDYVEKDYRPETSSGYELGDIGDGAGVLYAMGGAVYTDFIEVQSSSSYTVITGNTSATVLRVAEYDENKKYIKINKSNYELSITTSSTTKYIRISVRYPEYIQVSGLFPTYGYIQVKDYDNIQPNTTFTANSIDISNTQFTDVKLLCTTDTNTLKLPTTVKNFYCDSSFDLDTDYLEDGEYDVVHGELVEPYTTDYEGEVQIIESKETNASLPNLTWVLTDYALSADSGYPYVSRGYMVTDFIKVTPSTTVSVLNGDGTSDSFQCLCCYDENQNLLYGVNWKTDILLSSNAHYIRLGQNTSIATDNSYTLVYFPQVAKTPNLIPSSADGSLIFSMYAPSNTVAPASGTWDLHGLEFDNFYTFGMNNDVKIFMEKTQDINFAEAIELDNLEFNLNIELIANANDDRGYIRLCDGFKKRIIYFNRKSIAYAANIGSWVLTNLKKVDSSSATKLKLSVSEGILTYYLDGASFYSTNLNDIPYYDDAIYNEISIELIDDGGFNGIISSKTLTAPSNDINDIKSLTMPARCDDYNITIKNADISPKTHNTMLYPLLVNEDKSITGTLDYTNYAGKHLSWSFAYTDEEYVNIIQPKDELINSYKYKYNAFYDTEYEFDNPYEIARYTSSASGVLPTFNAEFTYTYDEKDNRDGTYTTKIYADSLDILPTWLSYQNKTNLLSVEKLKTGVLVSAEAMFQGCSSLTSVNISEIDVSNVGKIYRMFYGCNKLTEIQGIDNLSNGNFTNLWEMFLGCGSLTELDLSGFNTSNVTSMDGMFNGCSGLTSLDLSGFNTSKVTSMTNMFQNCSGLTSLDLSGFNTSKVTSMQNMFAGCNNLISLDLSGFDTSNVTIMASMFQNCRGLTSLDVSEFDTSNVTTMESMFYGCSSLKEVKGIENWDCSKVAKFGSMFQGAGAFGGDLDLRNWKVGQNVTVTSIYSFMNGCANLKSVDMSGWVLPDSINFANFMSNQGSLHTVRVIGWSAKNIQNLCSAAIGTYVGGTIYGDVIIDETYLQNDWVYNNVLEVAIYTSSASGVLPNFNTEFTYTHAEVDNGDGTYTTKVVADSIDNLPTRISFATKPVIRVDKLNTSQATILNGLFQNCDKLVYVNTENWDTSNVTNMTNMFHSCSKLTSLDLSVFNTANVNTMSQMFNGCSELTNLNVSSFDTANVTQMASMFHSCQSLTTLDVSGFDTGKVTNMSSMFNGCQNLTTLDVSNFDTSKVTTISMMFKNCHKLIALNVSNFDTSKVTNMSEMFFACGTLSSIEGLGNWDVKNVTDMDNMFLHCRGITSLLEISDWDTSSLKRLYRTFMGCTELIELDVSNWNTSKLETLLETFYSCSKIISFNLGNWDCRRVTSINAMFQGCSSLSSVILPKEVRKGCDAGNVLRNCTNLKEVALPKGIGNISHMLNNCYNLEKAVIPLDDITDVQDTTFNNCKALVDIDWVGDLSNNFNIISNTGEHVTTESDVHELMTNLGDLKKDKIKISLSKGTIKVNDTEKTIE